MRLRRYTGARFLERLRCQSERFGDAPEGINIPTERAKQENSKLRGVGCVCVPVHACARVCACTGALATCPALALVSGGAETRGPGLGVARSRARRGVGVQLQGALSRAQLARWPRAGYLGRGRCVSHPCSQWPPRVSRSPPAGGLPRASPYSFVPRLRRLPLRELLPNPPSGVLPSPAAIFPDVM